MTYEEFNAFCGSLPATNHVVQWGGAHVWKVDSKLFALAGWEKDENQPAFVFKVSDIAYEVLREQPGLRPAPYFAARGMKWIQQYSPEGFSDEELKAHIEQAHYLASLKLTKKRQKELGLNQEEAGSSTP